MLEKTMSEEGVKVLLLGKAKRAGLTSRSVWSSAGAIVGSQNQLRSLSNSSTDINFSSF